MASGWCIVVANERQKSRGRAILPIISTHARSYGHDPPWYLLHNCKLGLCMRHFMIVKMSWDDKGEILTKQNKTKNPWTHWLANSDAGVTFHLLNTMVTYCTKRIDEVPVTGCQVYNGFRLVVPTACLLPTTSDSAIAADVVGVATSSLAVERTASILVGTA